MVKDLNMRAKLVRLFEEIREVNLVTVGLVVVSWHQKYEQPEKIDAPDF